MKKKICSFMIALLLCLPVSITSCQQSSQNYALSYYDYFDTYSTIKLYGLTADEYAAAKATVDETLKTWHQYTDIYHAYDGIENAYSINHADGCQVLVTPEFAEFLLYGIEAYTLSQGTVNICMGTVTSLWHEAMTTHLVPTTEVLQEANLHTSIDNLSVGLEENGSYLVSLIDPLCQLDLGAIAKGYVAKILYNKLLNLNIQNFLITLGGAITTHGKPIGQNRDSFRVGITDAEAAQSDANTQAYLSETINIAPCGSVVTSGNYIRFFEADGVRYSHIIDPDTLTSAQRYKSVTIILLGENNDPCLGDILSTALFILDQTEGLALAESFGAKVIYQ